MKKIGIVGHAKEKFKARTAQDAKIAIGTIIDHYQEVLKEDITIVSGRSPMGGVDIWAEDIADFLGIPKTIFPPMVNNWEEGFKPRNLAIARESDVVYVIVVKELPEGFNGMAFDNCYHCVKHFGVGKFEGHIKSGGCWTAIKALEMGKEAEWILI